jgi:hypothetical protein
MVVRASSSSGRGKGLREELALHDEGEVSNPSDSCEGYDNLIPVPDGDTDGIYECPGNEETKETRVYVRIAINNIEVERVR